MNITGRNGLVFIELSVEEALRIYVGWSDLTVPLEDGFTVEDELHDAITEAQG